jgi:hypothetical protein
MVERVVTTALAKKTHFFPEAAVSAAIATFFTRSKTSSKLLASVVSA